MTLKKACEILKINEDATREEALQSYEAQKAQLNTLRLEPGNVGNSAAKKLDLLDEAYNEFIAKTEGEYRRYDTQNNAEFNHTDKNQNGRCDNCQEASATYFERIEQAIKNNDLETAQAMLDDLNERDAEWHYLQSIIYYKKSWFVESKKQLEMCVNMEPNNVKYQDSLNKLNKIMASKRVSPENMSSHDNSRPVYDNMPNGNGTCTGSCCGDICLANMCCDCCQCFCR
ncbi:MAG: hypothetical protein IKV38_03940 [Clostridia bacterium]|nr:hypothetical protein [Clostridia bacterium]